MTAEVFLSGAGAVVVGAIAAAVVAVCAAIAVSAVVSIKRSLEKRDEK